MLRCSKNHHSRGMSSSNSPASIFIADDSSLMRGAGSMRICGPKQQASIHGILAVFPNTAVGGIQLDGGAGLQGLRDVRSAAARIDFLVFNNGSDTGYAKGHPGIGPEDFFDKTAYLTSLCMRLSKPRSKSPINPL